MKNSTKHRNVYEHLLIWTLCSLNIYAVEWRWGTEYKTNEFPFNWSHERCDNDNNGYVNNAMIKSKRLTIPEQTKSLSIYSSFATMTNTHHSQFLITISTGSKLCVCLNYLIPLLEFRALSLLFLSFVFHSHREHWTDTITFVLYFDLLIFHVQVATK